jgi:hypothetical protein
MTRLWRLFPLAAAVALLAACGPAAQQNGQGTIGAAPTTAAGGGATSTTEPPNTSPSPVAPILPDGRSPVILKSVDVTNRTVTFDLIELYLGTQAAVEWKKDHPGDPNVPPLNGHYIRNNNTKLRTLPVSADVVVKTLDPYGDPDPTATIAFEALPTYKSYHGIFWITVVGGTVTMFEEQFFP